MCWLWLWLLQVVIHKFSAVSHAELLIEEYLVQRIFPSGTRLINVTFALFVYLLKYTGSLNWAGGGNWFYSQICMCSHSASWEFDIDCGPCRLLECFVHALLYLGRDKVVCQTQEKTNKPDSGSIYILLCNSLDLFLSAFVALLLRVTASQLILSPCWSTLLRPQQTLEYLPHSRCCIKRLINYQLGFPCGRQGNPAARWLCFETKPIKCVWIMSAFNWITVVDLELSELWESVLLIACLESVTSRKLSQNTQHWVRSAGPNQLLIAAPRHRFPVVLVQLFVFCPPDQCSGKPFVRTPHDKLTVAHWLCG